MMLLRMFAVQLPEPLPLNMFTFTWKFREEYLTDKPVRFILA